MPCEAADVSGLWTIVEARGCSTTVAVNSRMHAWRRVIPNRAFTLRPHASAAERACRWRPSGPLGVSRCEPSSRDKRCSNSTVLGAIGRS